MLFGATAIRSMVGDPGRRHRFRFRLPHISARRFHGLGRRFHIPRARFKGLGKFLSMGASFIPGVGPIAGQLLGGLEGGAPGAATESAEEPDTSEDDTFDESDDFGDEDQGDPGLKGLHRRRGAHKGRGHRGGRFHAGKIAEAFAGGIPGVGGGIAELLHEGMHGGRGGAGGRRRRINWANPRALSRAERRLGSFIHHFTRTARFLGMHVSRAPHRKRGHAFPRRRK